MHGSGEHLQLPATEASSRALRQALSGLCERHSVAPPARDEFIVAASEAFANAVLHGSANPEQVIDTWIQVDGEHCHLTLTYPGDPFPLEAPRLPDDHATNGRGRFIMDTFADQVRYSFRDGLTRVDLVRRWGQKPAGDIGAG